MPRNPNNPQEFIAGKLPEVNFRQNKFYVDGRMKELRNVEDHSYGITQDDLLSIQGEFTRKDLGIIQYEFEGINQYL